MDLSKISVRYAKAIFLLGNEKGVLDKIKEDIVLVSNTLKTVPDFQLVIESPVIKPSQKVAAINGIFKNSVHPVTLNFLNVLVQNKREQNLEGICRRFLHIYAESKGIKTALFTTAVKLDEKISKQLSELLAKTFNAQIELEQKHDPTLIGGYVLRIGDQQYDASVASSLRKMRQSLLK